MQDAMSDLRPAHVEFVMEKVSCDTFCLKYFNFPFCHKHSTNALISFIHHQQYIVLKTDTTVKYNISLSVSLLMRTHTGKLD
jgi:hypothetical protein